MGSFRRERRGTVAELYKQIESGVNEGLGERDIIGQVEVRFVLLI